MPERSKKKVLVVDDSPFHVARIRELLEESNLEVLECKNGQEAIEIIDREHEELDLLITDLDMPLLSGFELLGWLKEQSYGPHLSTLVLTGAYDLTDAVDKLKDLGINGILEKGGHPHHIISRVNSLLFPEIVEKRKFDRVSIHLPAIFVREEDHFDGVITNISLGGCFIVTEHLTRADDQLCVLLTIPFKEKKMKLNGIVTWVVGGDKWQGKRRNIEGLGVKWTDLSNEDRLLLEVFIEEKMKEERLYFMLSP